MRRLLFTVMASVALLAFGPAGAVAKHRHHHSRAHHSQVRHKRFGTDTGTTTTTPTGGQPADQPAGTVDSFTNGVLTILLSDGTTKVSGMVTDATDLECQSAQPTTGTGTEGQDLRSDGGGSGGDNGGGTTGTTGGTTGDDNGGTTGGDNGGTTGGDQGDDQGDQGDQGDDQGDNEQSCTTAALTPGAVVLSAELKLSSTGATWDKVELQQ